MEYADRTAAVTSALDPFGNTDGSRQSAVAEPTQLAIDQVVRDQFGIGSIVAKRRHDAYRQVMRIWNR
jgi:hypothetical protein